MTGERQRLPDRRIQTIQVMRWQGTELQWAVGYDRKGRAREVFVNGHKVGSDIEALVQDGCVLLSLLLQHGADPKDIAESLGREGIDPNAPAASLFGLLTAELPKVEATEHEAVLYGYAAAHGSEEEVAPCAT